MTPLSINFWRMSWKVFSRSNGVVGAFGINRDNSTSVGSSFPILFSIVRVRVPITNLHLRTSKNARLERLSPSLSSKARERLVSRCCPSSKEPKKVSGIFAPT